MLKCPLKQKPRISTAKCQMAMSKIKLPPLFVNLCKVYVSKGTAICVQNSESNKCAQSTLANTRGFHHHLTQVTNTNKAFHTDEDDLPQIAAFW